jgi:heptose I phosphotransferase
LKPWFNTLDIPQALLNALHPNPQEDSVFDTLMQLQGEVFRQMPGRCTSKIKLGTRYYFIKQHFGVGWKEIFKNLFTLKLPIISARTEMRAIQALNAIGILTTPYVAFGERGLNPATKQSFLITEDLGDIVSLEDVCANWRQARPSVQFKRHLIRQVAHMAGRMHASGLNHRDFYLCHICLHRAALASQPLPLILIDLHRMGVRKKISASHRMKDLAALLFSSLECGLSQQDYQCFLSVYQQYCVSPLSSAFWHQVNTRAHALYARQKRYVNRKW